jgi:hypothetical protein
MGSPRLPAGTLDHVIGTPGVARAIPIHRQFVVLDLTDVFAKAPVVGDDENDLAMFLSDIGQSCDPILGIQVGRRFGG